MVENSTANSGKQLVVLGCSATKVEAEKPLPAINLYDGLFFRVLRSFLRDYHWPVLRDYHWPVPLSVAVLSAKYGIIGGLSHI